MFFPTRLLEASSTKTCPVFFLLFLKIGGSRGELIECFLKQSIEKRFYGRSKDKLRFKNLAYALKQSRNRFLKRFNRLRFSKKCIYGHLRPASFYKKHLFFKSLPMNVPVFLAHKHPRASQLNALKK